jgi:hypothetical protein
MNDIWMQPRGVIIAFPDKSSRPHRSRIVDSEPRGEVLLFTGVRYERPLPNPGPSHPFASDGSGRRRQP